MNCEAAGWIVPVGMSASRIRVNSRGRGVEQTALALSRRGRRYLGWV